MRRGGAVSAAGEALHRLPPTVPTSWVCQPPTVAAASRRAGRPAAMSGSVASFRWVVSGPIDMAAFDSMRSSPGIRPMWTRADGEIWRLEYWIMTSVPPARICAPSPSSSREARASAIDPVLQNSMAAHSLSFETSAGVDLNIDGSEAGSLRPSAWGQASVLRTVGVSGHRRPGWCIRSPCRRAVCRAGRRVRQVRPG